ncbi:nucleotidyltransferase domain-containing protein [Cupriavidus basilensis]|uniref:nucleotidyltransferase domain-containing protein n=1 Tax=Cupriavidus basilensis TaxID=68895 RepID=UPI0023E7DACE|nr:nucleotidyltransferase [Cupriavidus basilensis]MDF3887915.1 nucleotidyltransferase [Cupriavidus basilensis]
MAMTKNAMLVEQAIKRRGGVAELTKSMGIAMDGFSEGLFDSAQRSDVPAKIIRAREPFAHALSLINDHITVRQEEIEAASAAYEDIARRLVDKLDWPISAISIHPQGSASTKTLIRMPDRTKFDIDAVCEVDITKLQAQDPMTFFGAIGEALDGLEVEPKKRCWKINFSGKPFYIECTPSVPLETIPVSQQEASRLKAAEPEFANTALAVVDTPQKKWKTSNPAGIRNWVERVSARNIVANLVLEEFTKSARANIQPVSPQSVEVEETLRVAIRLFKRHRDMRVYRQEIDKDFQPISIILVTLVTICYDGLADLIEEGVLQPFSHPVDALVAIADLLPEMIVDYPGTGYQLANPTVVGENFAERWNDDDGERAQTFDVWCGLLRADLERISALTDPKEIEAETREVFGCHAGSGPAGSGGSGGSGPYISIPRPPKPAPSTPGLA